MRPAEFRQLIRDAGRVPAERHTTYALKHVFDNPAEDPVDLLDQVDEHPEERFGSYFQLIKMDDFRFQHPHLAKAEG